MDLPNQTAEPPSPGLTRCDPWVVFLGIWSGVVILAVTLLLTWHPSAAEPVLLLPGHDDARVPMAAQLRHALLLAHLGLYRAYPWVLLGPYVVWLASRFSLERGRLRMGVPVQVIGALLFTLACQTLDRLVSAAQPTRVIVSVTETLTNGPRSDPEAEPALDHFTRVIRVSTNVPAGGALGPEDMDLLLASFSNSMAGLDTNVLADPPPGRAGLTVEHRRWTGPPRLVLGTHQVVAGLMDLFAFASLVGLGHAVHFYRRFQERERRTASLEASLTRARLHALQAQLHPHFLFNTLNSITSLVRQNPRAAEETLTSLADLLRLALSQSTRQEVPLREELRFLEVYFEIQRTRFGDRLAFESTVDPSALDCLVPSLLLQPLVENAIRHGIEPAGRPGRVRVGADLQEARLELSVADDGVGCPALVHGQPPLGVGLTNVRDRLHSLYATAATLEFLEGASGGLTVRLRVPMRHEGRDLDSVSP